MEISAAIPTSPSLFRVDSHASFGHVQRERRVLAVGSSERKVVHDFPCRNTRGQNNSAKPARLRRTVFGSVYARWCGDDSGNALAQFVRRLGYDDCVQKASQSVFYSGRTEADMMWAALCILQRDLAAAGFSPR
jgi:hypothetical protein